RQPFDLRHVEDALQLPDLHVLRRPPRDGHDLITGLEPRAAGRRLFVDSSHHDFRIAQLAREAETELCVGWLVRNDHLSTAFGLRPDFTFFTLIFGDLAEIA